MQNEREILSAALAGSDRKVGMFPDATVDAYFGALNYMLEDGVYEVYGDIGFMDALGRRVLVLESDTILGIADNILPSNYTVNRAFVRQMLEICASGEWPEWSAGRFIDKIVKHLSKPYSNEAFQAACAVKVEQAQRSTERIFRAIPEAIAVGYTGSVAREDYFGLHPESDLDLLFYSYGSQSTLRSLHALIKTIEEEENVYLCLAGDFNDAKLMPQPFSLITTPDGIEEVLWCAGEGLAIAESMQLASNHVHGVVPFVRFRDIYEKEIDAPLRDFYAQQAPFCREEIADQVSLRIGIHI